MGGGLILYSFSLARNHKGDRRLSIAQGVCITFSITLVVLAWLGISALSGSGTSPIREFTYSVGFIFIISIWVMAFVASVYGALFFDDVAAAVEARYYPDLPVVPTRPLADRLAYAVIYVSIQIASNLMVLSLLVNTGSGTGTGDLLKLMVSPVVCVFLNGWLLGRQYFLTAARRHLSKEDARALYKKEFGMVWGAGILMAAPLLVPVVNLIIPALGAATFTHLVQLEEVEQDESDDLSSLTDREGSSGPDEEPVPVRRSQFVPLSEPTPSSSPSTSKDVGP
jgi:uncharacterized protein involved in cysteine biosynthesis